MAKHTMTKRMFLGILALSAGCVLAACDPIAAVPSNYNTKIVATKDGEIDLDGNNLGSLWDAISSEKNEKVVNNILSEIAEAKFGSYADLLNKSKSEFIEAHKSYFGEDASRASDRYDDFVADINSRISEFFYNEITSSSYADELGRFSEKKFYNKLAYDLYDLADVDPANFKTYFVDRTLTKENAFSSERLNLNAYKVVSTSEAKKHGYIQEKVYPDILRNKLVEDYIYANNRSSLGRAYGRKVNIVKISYEEGSKFEEKLAHEFAKQHIVGTRDFDLEILANAQKGFLPGDDLETTLVKPLTVDGNEDKLVAVVKEEAKITVPAYKYHEGAADEITIVSAGDYYPETKLGKILVDYKKAVLAEAQGRFPSDENKEALEKFTSEGKSKEAGLLEKVKSLIKEDATTDGWYVKSDGLSDLPAVLRDRLFNIRVANVLDDSTQLYEETGSNIGKYEAYYEEHNLRVPYLRNINGKKLLLQKNALSPDEGTGDPYNYIYDDTSAKSIYIVEVLEAPSTAKLDTASTTAYGEGDSILKEQHGRQIAKILGTKDSYIKDAYTEELNKFTDFKFYDSSLYDYLKSEYPDLSIFDED